nr:hypothetical protein [Methylocystis sp.]
MRLRFAQNPLERHIGELILGVTPADIGMDAREPDLRNASGFLGILRCFFPKQRVKGLSFVVERQSVARPIHIWGELQVAEDKRPKEFVYAILEFRHR